MKREVKRKLMNLPNEYGECDSEGRFVIRVEKWEKVVKRIMEIIKED